MKNKSILLAGLFLVIITFGAFRQNNNTYEQRESLILHAVLNFIDQVHVNPKPIDDHFSEYVYDSYLERIDGGKRFFIQPEIDQLSAYRLNIDEQCNARDFTFFDKSYELYENALKRAEKIYTDLKENHKFDFDAKEYYEFDGKKKTYAKDEADLKDMWRRYLKYDIVQKYYSAKTKNQKAYKKYLENLERWKKENPSKKVTGDKLEFKDGEAVEVVKEKTTNELLQKAQEKSFKGFDSWFERLHKLRRSDRFETYLGSITNYFDPHTSYFNPKEKQDFDINMGGKLEGIGARLTIDGDYTKIVSIIPGGPAYRGKELEVDDLIMGVTQENGEHVDITGWRIDDVVQKIRGKKGTKVKLTVQKPDGTIKDITITRDKVIIDESFARSLIIGLEGSVKNVGYIKLPKFYSSFDNKGGNSCARDVAKELEKLKKEHVNAIILDLRNNTGGSLNDVVKMSGLFLEKGPIVQVKPRDRPAYVHDDKDPEVQYDGPLIIMTNHQSASASEILAAALQDYGRAIIVGSKYTFGKGSVQRFFNLDRAINRYDDLKPLGSLKISMQKFYRVNGGSTQLKGVTPDIIIPNSYHYIETGEKEYDNPLPWDEITPADYQQHIVKLNHLDEIKKRSEDRVSHSKDYQLVLENAKRIKANQDLSKYPVCIDLYEEMMKEKEKESKKFDALYENDIDGLTVKNLDEDMAYIESEESRIGRNEDWIKGVKKDFNLKEALMIIQDLISVEEEYRNIDLGYKE